MWCGTKAEPKKGDWGYCEVDKCAQGACKIMSPDYACDYGINYCDGLISAEKGKRSCKEYCEETSDELVCTDSWINDDIEKFPCKGARIPCDQPFGADKYHVCRCEKGVVVTKSPTQFPTAAITPRPTSSSDTLCSVMEPSEICDSKASSCIGKVDRNFFASCDKICGIKNLQCSKAWGPGNCGAPPTGTSWSCGGPAPAFCECVPLTNQGQQLIFGSSYQSMIVSDYGSCGSSFILATVSESQNGFACLTSDSQTSSIDSQPCEANTVQKWVASDDRLVSADGQCLVLKGGQFTKQKCVETTDQSWTMKNFQIILESDGFESCVDKEGNQIGCSIQGTTTDWNVFNGKIFQLPFDSNDGVLDATIGSAKWTTPTLPGVSTVGHDLKPDGAYRLTTGKSIVGTFSSISRMPGIDGLTIMMWVKTSQPVSVQGSNLGTYWELIFDSSSIGLGLKDTGEISVRLGTNIALTSEIIFEKWIHIAVVLQDGSYFFVIDGKRQAETETYLSENYNFITRESIMIGSQASIFTFDVDDFAVYQWGLELAEVKMNYDCGGGTDGWYSYNDFIDQSVVSSSPTGTTYFSYTTSNGALIDSLTGETLPVRITTSSNSSNPAIYVIGEDCETNTDADNIFNGKVNLQGNLILTVNEFATIEISKLDMKKTYELVLTANGGESLACRFTKVVLLGADSFVEDSSVEVITRDEEKVSFCAGSNKDTGQVVRWKNIWPGADGKISVETTVSTAIPGGGNLGLAMSAMRLHLEPNTPMGPSPVSTADVSPPSSSSSGALIAVLVIFAIVFAVVVGYLLYRNKIADAKLSEEREKTLRAASKPANNSNLSQSNSSTTNSGIRLTTHLQTFKFDDLRDPVLIGEGAFKKVFSADLRGTPVAVAVLKVAPAAHLSQTQQSLMWQSLSSEFLKEVHLNSSLNHQNIVQFMGVVDNPAPNEPKPRQWNAEGLCFVSELYPRGSLYDVLYKHRTRMDHLTKMKIAVGICRGLAFLHYRNIVHLDLKPMNVLLTDDNNPKICDFGLAEIRRLNEQGNMDSGLPSSLKGAGTMRYWAPEQFPMEAFGNRMNSKAAKSKITEKTDIWALGCVLIELFSGIVAWSEKDVMFLTQHVAQGIGERQSMHIPPEINNVSDSAVQGILLRCFFRDGKKRPGADSLVKSLGQVSPGLSQSGYSQTSNSSPRGPPSNSQLPPHSRKPPQFPSANR